MIFKNFPKFGKYEFGQLKFSCTEINNETNSTEFCSIFYTVYLFIILIQFQGLWFIACFAVSARRS